MYFFSNGGKNQPNNLEVSLIYLFLYCKDFIFTGTEPKTPSSCRPNPLKRRVARQPHRRRINVSNKNTSFEGNNRHYRNPAAVKVLMFIHLPVTALFRIGRTFHCAWDLVHIFPRTDTILDRLLPFRGSLIPSIPSVCNV